MPNDSISTPACHKTGQQAPPLDWLLSLLQEAMLGVMADDTSPLKKANALARLASLYLKTYGAADLKRTNAELVGRVAELEERLTGAGGPAAAGEDEAAAQPQPEKAGRKAASRAEKAKRPKPHSHKPRHPTTQQPSGPSRPRQSTGKARADKR